MEMKVDRTRLSVVKLTDSGDAAWWATRSPQERLEAVEIHRQAAYGLSATSQRLQRVLEVVKRA
jgi:hypothetical protein